MVRYQRPIYNAAWWVLRDAEDARDVAQIVFMKVAERSDEYDPRYRFFSWIYRIAVNECLNARRARRPGEQLDERLPDAEDGPQEIAEHGERSASIDAALVKLSEEHRLVLVLRHFADLSYGEMSDVLGIPEKTVKSRLFEARHRLGELLRLEPGAQR